MSMRVFSANPSIPILAACELCGTQITVRRFRDSAGHLWVSGEELVKAWIDHQLLECTETTEGVSNEGTVCG